MGKGLRFGGAAVLLAALLAGSVMIAREVRGPAHGAPGDAGARSCQRPYANTSPWNTPIGADPRVSPRTAEHVAELGAPLTSDPTQYTYPVYTVRPGDERVDVVVDGRFSDVTARGRRLTIRKGGTVRLPIPAGARAAAGTDAQIVLVDAETGEEWGAWRLRRSGLQWRIENGYRYNTRWSGVPPRAGDGNPFGSRGAGVPYLAGLVRPCEIDRGRIDHALAFAYKWPRRDHVFPATKSDGLSADPADLPEGARLQLDPSLTRDDLRGLGCAGACATIARALQEYGMYVIDNAGRPKVMLEYEDTARWGGLVNAETVSPIPMSSFRVVER